MARRHFRRYRRSYKSYGGYKKKWHKPYGKKSGHGFKRHGRKSRSPYTTLASGAVRWGSRTAMRVTGGAAGGATYIVGRSIRGLLRGLLGR
jgi:hypothetical protein